MSPVRSGFRCAALAASVTAIGIISPTIAAPRHPALEHIPRLVLWAWERPVDLRGLDGETGVAFLAQTIVVREGRVVVLPRRQPLRVSSGTSLIAVTRIEIPPVEAISTAALDEIAREIGRTVTPGIDAVQVDFDATRSQRAAYIELLRRVRDTLDRNVPLSITALASWCMDDRWLEDLPIDEAVPMLFRLGDGERRSGRQRTVSAITAPACRGAFGVSLDEPVALPSGPHRVYVFNPERWSESAVAAARQEGSR